MGSDQKESVNFKRERGGDECTMHISREISKEAEAEVEEEYELTI